MKYLKMLGLAAIAAAALMAFIGAGTASATVLCKVDQTTCPAGQDYAAGTKVHADLKSAKAVLKAGFANIECETSTIIGKTSNTGGASETVFGPIETLAFGSCGAATVTVVKSGELEIHHEANNNGVLTAKGVEVKVKVGATECTYGGTITTGLTLHKSPSSTGHAVATATEASIPRLGGGILCANPSKWSAEYTVTEPKPLYVSEKSA